MPVEPIAGAWSSEPRFEFGLDLEGTTRKVILLSILLAWNHARVWATARPLAIWHWDFFGLHRIADLSISLACLVISLFLVLHYLRPWRRRDVPYQSIVWMIAG